jgi:hypothetical protein
MGAPPYYPCVEGGTAYAVCIANCGEGTSYLLFAYGATSCFMPGSCMCNMYSWIGIDSECTTAIAPCGYATFNSPSGGLAECGSTGSCSGTMYSGSYCINETGGLGIPFNGTWTITS